MSARGENVPEIADVLAQIARRIIQGEASKDDAQKLRNIAKLFEGKGPQGELLKLHRKAQRPRDGAQGVYQRFELAKAIAAYREEHKSNLPDTYDALAKLRGYPTARSLEKAWKEMRSVLRLNELEQKLVIYFKALEAERPGSVVISKGAKKKG